MQKSERRVRHGVIFQTKNSMAYHRIYCIGSLYYIDNYQWVLGEVNGSMKKYISM